MPGDDQPVMSVALVEDDISFQNSFGAVIAAAADMTLNGTAHNVAQALALLDRAPLDVLIVDLGLPDGSGIDVIRAAHAAWPDCGIMVSTTFADEKHVIASIEAGAAGYRAAPTAIPSSAGPSRRRSQSYWTANTMMLSNG